MMLALLRLCFIFAELEALDPLSTSNSAFDGAKYWADEWLKLCETKNATNNAFSCHAFIRNYQFINVEILSEDPTLFIYRGFASAGYIKDFLNDVHEKELVEQKVVKEGEENVTEVRPTRRANGTWIPHTASYGVARMYRRAVALLPFINFENSEHWQVLSYLPGGHYAPHNDYINFTSSASYDEWMKAYGNRMATFFLLLQSAKHGGGTVFPNLHTAAHPSAGDVVFWANVDHTGAMEQRSLHGGCPVYEGEKIAATLWIRMKGQNIFRSASNRLNLRELMEMER